MQLGVKPWAATGGGVVGAEMGEKWMSPPGTPHGADESPDHLDLNIRQAELCTFLQSAGLKAWNFKNQPAWLWESPEVLGSWVPALTGTGGQTAHEIQIRSSSLKTARGLREGEFLRDLCKKRGQLAGSVPSPAPSTTTCAHSLARHTPAGGLLAERPWPAWSLQQLCVLHGRGPGPWH